MSKTEYQKSVREGCLHAGSRCYFFDVKETKAKDYFLVITESKKSQTSNAVVKHKIFIYKEHLEGFQSLLAESISFIKKEKGDEVIRWYFIAIFEKKRNGSHSFKYGSLGYPSTWFFIAQYYR